MEGLLSAFEAETVIRSTWSDWQLSAFEGGSGAETPEPGYADERT